MLFVSLLLSCYYLLYDCLDGFVMQVVLNMLHDVMDRYVEYQVR